MYKRIASRADEAIHSNHDSAIDLLRNSALYFEITLSCFLCHSFDYNLNNIIATLSFDFFGKKLPANAIKVWAAILNLVKFLPFDRRHSDKNQKINILRLGYVAGIGQIAARTPILPSSFHCAAFRFDSYG